MIRIFYFQCFLVILLTLFSCKNEKQKEQPDSSAATKLSTNELGKEIFEGKGMCYSCHLENKKIIGPSIVEIATIYKNKNGNIIQFLKGIDKPIVDPSQYEIMKTNFAITKNLPENELKALEDYMLGFAK